MRHGRVQRRDHTGGHDGSAVAAQRERLFVAACLPGRLESEISTPSSCDAFDHFVGVLWCDHVCGPDHRGERATFLKRVHRDYPGCPCSFGRLDHPKSEVSAAHHRHAVARLEAPDFPYRADAR
ncbi:hypothetical protein B7435_29120 [Mycolicibacterium peregrinum]|nr:hypothetical protein B7435_29120 [Mycolicibacterium peregrinum]